MSDAGQARRRALRLSLPVLAGYIVLGIAFGATLAQAGYGPAWALLISTTVYAGSLQFVMAPLMASGASLLTVALTALMEQGLPFDLTGIDFSMTALFTVICVERAMNRGDRLPMALGAVIAVASLLLLGPDRFLAPALAATALALTVMQLRAVGEGERHED